MFKEFKEFAMRGNVLDMAIGLILGGALGRIVNSLVEDIIMPPVGLLIGKINLKDMFINLTGATHSTLEKAQYAGDVTVNYGRFINQIIDFVIVAFVVYLLVKQINRFRRNKDDYIAGLKTKSCPYCTKAIPHKAVRCPYCTSKLI